MHSTARILVRAAALLPVALGVVIVACGALGPFAAGMSTAAATAWLRRRLAGHVFA